MSLADDFDRIGGPLQGKPAKTDTTKKKPVPVGQSSVPDDEYYIGNKSGKLADLKGLDDPRLAPPKSPAKATPSPRMKALANFLWGDSFGGEPYVGPNQQRNQERVADSLAKANKPKK